MAKKKEKMRIRYLVPMAEPDRAIPVGSEREVEPAEGARLVKAGFAEAVAQPTAGRRQATA